MLKRLITFCLIPALICACLPAASATPSVSTEASDLASKQALASSITEKLSELSIELELAGQELYKINEQVASTKKKIKKTQARIEAAEEELAASKEQLADYVVDEYKNGTVSYLSVLLSATSFGDFTSRMYLLSTIVKDQSATTEQVRELTEELATLESTLEEKLAKQKTLKAEAKVKQATVNASLAAQQELLDSVNSEIAEIIAEQEAAAAAEAAAKAAEEAAAAAAAAEAESSSDSTNTSKKTTSAADAGSSSTSGNHAEVVSIAKKYLGVAYVWGGTSPSGFDCSGLVQYCYAKIGISLPRVACDQYNAGTHIKKSALMPGDLVFFGYSAAGIYHVGIYIGDGQYIHAPQTGDVVKISYLAGRSDYYGACRP